MEEVTSHKYVRSDLLGKLTRNYKIKKINLIKGVNLIIDIKVIVNL